MSLSLIFFHFFQRLQMTLYWPNFKYLNKKLIRRSHSCDTVSITAGKRREQDIVDTKCSLSKYIIVYNKYIRVYNVLIVQLLKLGTTQTQAH